MLKDVEAAPQEPISRELLIADIEQLAAVLGSAHPDPFTRIGGRIAYYRVVREAIERVPAAGMTRKAFFKLIRPIAAAVRDGHTFIRDEWRDGDDNRVWLELEPIDDHLVVTRVFDRRHEKALGHVLVSVDGVAFDELTRRMAERRGYDNRFGNLKHLARALSRTMTTRDLMEKDRIPGSLVFKVSSPKGKETSLDVATGAIAPGPPILPPSKLKLPQPNAADMAWGYVGKNKRVAYLRLDSMRRYREAFERWRSAGYERGLGKHLDLVAAAASPGHKARTVADKIALVPSATEMLTEMTEAMNAAGSQELVLDLRRNEGGNSFMDLIVQYFLYPLDAIIRAERGYQVPRYSKLYFDNYKNADASTRSMLGRYDYQSEMKWRRERSRKIDSVEYDRRLKVLGELAEKAPTFARAFSSRQLNASWTGSVFVVMSAFTYSAGFDLAVALMRHGATLVGTPSSQAGNCFIDTLGFQLKNSRLTVNVSYKLSLLFPDNAEMGRVLPPKRLLSYARFAEFKFDPNASIMLALGKPGARAADLPGLR